MSEKIKSTVNCPDTDIFPDKMVFKTYPCLYYEWLKWIHDNCCSGGGGTGQATDITSSSLDVGGSGFSRNIELPPFDDSIDYTVGKLVIYNQNLWAANIDVPAGAWDPINWELISAGAGSAGASITSNTFEVVENNGVYSININNYDTSSSYAQNNIIINPTDNCLYQAKQNIQSPSGTFDPSKWQLIGNAGGGTTINAWTASTLYSIGDIVTYHNNLYRCKTANTDTSFNYNKWEVLSNAVLQGYDASTTYDIRDVVTQNGNIYKCNTAGTTGVWNISKWDLLSSGPTISSDSLEVETSSTGTTININNYNRNASYRLGNLVIYLDDNCLYKAKQNITAPAGNWDPSLWTLIGPSGGASGINSWMSGTNYSVGDVVTYHNNTYRCSTNNSDTSFTYNKWEVLSNAVLQGYDGTNNYVIRDVVSYNGNIYKCNASAGATGTWDPSKWDLLSTGTTTQITIDDFDAAGLYAAGDLVAHDDNIYRAKISITPGVWTSTDWELISIGLPQFTAFSTTNSYYLGDKIIYNGNMYQCSKTGPITGAFNASDWTLISTGVITQITINDFSAAGSYVTGDLVSYQDNIYRAKQAITPHVWTDSDWEIISIGLKLKDYDTSKSYYMYDQVIYNSNIYRCNKAGPITGAFNVTDWDLISTGQSISGKADKNGSFVTTVDNNTVKGLTTTEVKTAVSGTNKLLTQSDAIQGLSSASLTVDTTTLTASTVELKAQDTTSAVSLGTGTTAGKLNVKTDDLSITKDTTDGKLKAIAVTAVSGTNKLVTQTELAAVAGGSNILGGWWYAKTTTAWTVPTPTMTTENYIDLSATPVKTYTAKSDLTGWDESSTTITPSAGDVVLITEAYWDITQANTGGSSYYTAGGWVHVPASVRDVDNISIEVSNNILSAITKTATATNNKIVTETDLTTAVAGVPSNLLPYAQSTTYPVGTLVYGLYQESAPTPLSEGVNPQASLVNYLRCVLITTATTTTTLTFNQWIDSIANATVGSAPTELFSRLEFEKACMELKDLFVTPTP